MTDNFLFNNLLLSTLKVKTTRVSAPIGPSSVAYAKLTYKVSNYILAGVLTFNVFKSELLNKIFH
jgi:hypothetical protein